MKKEGSQKPCSNELPTTRFEGITALLPISRLRVTYQVSLSPLAIHHTIEIHNEKWLAALILADEPMLMRVPVVVASA
jgi:hypothetical protein